MQPTQIKYRLVPTIKQRSTLLFHFWLCILWYTELCLPIKSNLRIKLTLIFIEYWLFALYCLNVELFAIVNCVASWLNQMMLLERKISNRNCIILVLKWGLYFIYVVKDMETTSLRSHIFSWLNDIFKSWCCFIISDKSKQDNSQL